VAIKLLRNNEHMKRTGKKEMKILTKLRDTDPQDKYNIVRLLTHFIDRDHLCLAFEPMDLNLRQLIKKNLSKRGLDLKSVRVYGYKLLKALFHLKRQGIIHADLKPDNILVNENRSIMKLGDLGSAFEGDEKMEPTPLLVSRFYRAPEIILGLPYSHPLDMFSYGACLYELSTGDYLLKSIDNNQHLELFMQIKGLISKKLVLGGIFRDTHFDKDCNFLRHVTDKVTGKLFVKKLNIPQEPTRSILPELLQSFPNESEKLVNELSDLILNCIETDPAKRYTPVDGLKHPFFNLEEEN